MAGKLINPYTTNGCDKEHETRTKFYVCRWLSTYALRCGYMEFYEVGGIRVSLAQDGCYHVRATGKDAQGNNVYIWNTHTVLVNARRDFIKTIKYLEGNQS